MPQSGIVIDDEVKTVFQRVFMKNKANKLPYAIFRFSEPDLAKVVVDDDAKYYDKELSYDDLLGSLPVDKPRFVAYEFGYMNKDNNRNESVILLSWCPRKCIMKHKFVCGTTFMNLVQTLKPSKYFEGEELSELNEDAICDKQSWGKCPPESRPALREEPLNVKE